MSVLLRNGADANAKNKVSAKNMHAVPCSTQVSLLHVFACQSTVYMTTTYRKPPGGVNHVCSLG